MIDKHKRSRQLIQCIREAINQTNHRRFTFANFMTFALFHPRLGYYSANSPIFGKRGDFVTAPEISSLFSRSLAHYCERVLRPLSSERRTVVEIGAGTGQMAINILLELECRGCLPARYVIVETSDSLASQQRDHLQTKVPHLLNRVEHIKQLPLNPVEGVIVANEVMDVLPVHIFGLHEGLLREHYVSWRQDRFIWESDQPSTPELSQVAKQIQKDYLKDTQTYVSEIRLSIDKWLLSLKSSLTRGCIILIDYGFVAREYYHAQRTKGTLRCYYRHRWHENPFELVGLQDITSDVNFSQVAEVASRLGLEVARFTSQAAFLLGSNLEMMQSSKNAFDYLNMKGNFYQLVSPNEMGELCKVMMLNYNFQEQWAALADYDRRASL